MTGFTIDELVMEARRVSQNIGTANRALSEVFQEVVINMHHFFTQMKGSTNRTEQQIAKFEQDLNEAQTDISEIKVDVAVIKSNVVVVKEKVNKIDDLEGHLLTARKIFSAWILSWISRLKY